MVMSTGNFPQDLRPGIRMWFGNAYKAYDTKYDKILDVKVPDDRAYEEDVMLAALGLPVLKTQGTSVTFDQGDQLFSTRFVHLQYGLGFVITEEMASDGIALKMGKVFAENLKLSMLRGREIFAHNVYINLFSSTLQDGMEGGDGVAPAASNHPTLAANFSNVPSTAAGLSEASIEQAVIDIQNYTDNRGIIIAVRPAKLIVPLALQFQAERILKSPLRAGTADNDINAVRNLAFIPEIVVSPYLTSNTNWFVKTDQPGMVFFNRKDIVLSEDNDFDTENMKTKGLMRMSAGMSDPRAIYGVNA